MKKFFSITSLCLFALAFATAQQEAHYTNFMYNKLLLNPASAGARETPSITAIHRSQWIGFDGAPASQLISFSSPFIVNRTGIGATVSMVKMGFQRDIFAQLAYSYDLIGRDGISVRIGLHGSLRQFRLDFGDPMTLNLAVPFDESIQQGGIQKKLFGNFGAGLYASYKDIAYGGFSAPNLYATQLNSINLTAAPESLAVLKKHFYLMGGLGLRLSEKVRFLPQFLVKYVNNAPLDADLTGTLEFDRKAGIGLNLRYGGDNDRLESADLMAFFKARNQFTIGASFDFTLTKLKDYTAGSFEAFIMADLKKSKNEMSNPRFFF